MFICGRLKKASGIVAGRREIAEETVRGDRTKRMTADAIENMAFMEEDTIWDATARGAAAEAKLKHKLEELFMGEFKKKNYKKWHKAMIFCH